MGSTYLELTNRVLRRINEVELDASSFTDCRGVHAAAKDAVLDTIRDINSQKFEWPFNAAAGTQLLTVGQELYTWPTDLRMVDWESFYIEKDDTLGCPTSRLEQISKDEWYKYLRSDDFDSTTLGRDRPRFIFEFDNGGFGVSPSPNQAFTVKFRYWLKTIEMDVHTDETTIPEEYNQVITDGAINLLYMFLDNDERANVALSSYKRGLDYMSYILIPKDNYAYDRVNNRSTLGSRKMWNGR
jgi:hypothetical protein